MAAIFYVRQIYLVFMQAGSLIFMVKPLNSELN